MKKRLVLWSVITVKQFVWYRKVSVTFEFSKCFHILVWISSQTEKVILAHPQLKHITNYL
jgi:hypothetical protein